MIISFAIETSTDTCSVSIGNCQEVFSYHENIPKQHTEKLLSVINNLLEERIFYEDLSAGCRYWTRLIHWCEIILCCSSRDSLFSELKGITLPSIELLSIQAHEETFSNPAVAISELNMGKVYISKSIFRKKI